MTLASSWTCVLHAIAVAVVPQGHIDANALHRGFVDGVEVAIGILSFFEKLVVGDFDLERTADTSHLGLHRQTANGVHIAFGGGFVHRLHDLVLEAEEDALLHRLVETKELDVGSVGNGGTGGEGDDESGYCEKTLELVHGIVSKRCFTVGARSKGLVVAFTWSSHSRRY